MERPPSLLASPSVRTSVPDTAPQEPVKPAVSQSPPPSLLEPQDATVDDSMEVEGGVSEAASTSETPVSSL